VIPKKTKESPQEKGDAPVTVLSPAPIAAAPNSAAAGRPTPSAAPLSAAPSEADQLKASIAATAEAERPADPASVTTTTSQDHANRLLRDAIGAIFAPGLDDRMMAAMPDFWKLYYQAVATKADYRPADAAIQRQNTVDQKAHLLTSFEPDSNDFAQTAGVAGMALYHTVIGADGKPGEIAVARPIGFGLDENAVAAIRKAKFSPTIKKGQPVPVMLDLVVSSASSPTVPLPQPLRKRPKKTRPRLPSRPVLTAWPTNSFACMKPAFEEPFWFL
jgi:TonB family protein